MTSLWIRLLLPLIDFLSENCHTMFGCIKLNWITNKGETGGGGGGLQPI